MVVNGEERVPELRFLRSQAYWLLPIVVATVGLTLLLFINPRWGGDAAAIVAIPVNVAAALIPVLLHFGVFGSGERGRATRSRNKLRVAGVFTVAALLLSTGSYLAIQESDPEDVLSGTVRIGINTENYPGWNASNGGRPQGFDIELANFLGEYFGFTPQFVEVGREERVTKLAEHRDDITLVIANFSITPEREEAIDFAGPYFIDSEAALIWLDPKSKVPLPTRGIVCVPSGTTANERLKKLGYTPEQSPSLAACVERFQRKEPNLAVSTDAAILEAYVRNNADLGLPEPVLSMGLEKYGVGIRNNSPRLCAALNEAIDEFLLYKWSKVFDQHLTGMDVGNRKPARTETCRPSNLWG